MPCRIRNSNSNNNDSKKINIMTTSNNGIKLIISFEGFRSEAYWDVNGYAIGYGSHYYPNGSTVKQTDTCTKQQAMQYLKHHLDREVEPYINNKGLSLNQNQYDALASLVYNIGCGNWNNSNLLRLLQQVENPSDNDLRAAFLQYSSGGLYNRRMKEYEYYKKKAL